MGADLITALAVWPKDKELDWDAGRKIIDTLDIADVPDHVIDDIFPDAKENTPEELIEVRDGLRARLNDAEQIIGSGRNTAIYTLFGHNVLIIGSMSWGDLSDGFAELTSILDTKPVARAIGFNLNAFA